MSRHNLSDEVLGAQVRQCFLRSDSTSGALRSNSTSGFDLSRFSGGTSVSGCCLGMHTRLVWHDVLEQGQAFGHRIERHMRYQALRARP